jgi:hypothetical protein
LAAPAAADSADSAALGAQVREEPVVPVRARLVLVRRPVPADLLLRLAVLVPVHLAVLVHRPVPADPLLEGRPVLAHLVLEAAVPVELLLSRQSFSAAMARSTP